MTKVKVTEQKPKGYCVKGAAPTFTMQLNPHFRVSTTDVPDISITAQEYVEEFMPMLLGITLENIEWVSETEKKKAYASGKLATGYVGKYPVEDVYEERFAAKHVLASSPEVLIKAVFKVIS